jgi:hypothetical protein
MRSPAPVVNSNRQLGGTPDGHASRPPLNREQTSGLGAQRGPPGYHRFSRTKARPVPAGPPQVNPQTLAVMMTGDKRGRRADDDGHQPERLPASEVETAPGVASAALAGGLVGAMFRRGGPTQA